MLSRCHFQLTRLSRRSLFVKRFESSSSNDSSNKLYLHVGPAGDCWTGRSIFAAKHLQPDYVKSIELPDNVPHSSWEALLEELENDPGLAQQVYDQESIPAAILERFKKT